MWPLRIPRLAALALLWALPAAAGTEAVPAGADGLAGAAARIAEAAKGIETARDITSGEDDWRIHRALARWSRAARGEVTGFRSLAGYIFGGNEGGKKIAMTAPVHMEMGADSSRMRFVMPSDLTMDSLPEPNDANVKLSQLNKMSNG